MAYDGCLPHSLQESISQLLWPHTVLFVRQVQMQQPKVAAESRFLAMTPWRAYVFPCKQPLKQVESSFNYLEIYAIAVGSQNQLVIDTDRQSYTFALTSMEDMEAVVSHMAASLKKIFPDSSPGKLLKKVPGELQERLRRLTDSVEEQLSGVQGPCGGFSETYAALCDFNEFPCREEIQWDVDNIYHIQNCREFNLLDFSHLDTRDLALAVAALSFNQWFTKISNKDFRLSLEVQEQVLYMINRSPKLEELCLESSGLRPDFAARMAYALRDHTGSVLHTINLSANHIEDKGVTALSQQLEKLPITLSSLSLARVSLSPKGMVSLMQMFSHKCFSTSLHHLDLSGNPGSLSTEEAVILFKFLSGDNVVSHLDLSETDCPLDTLFVSLSAGCCSKLNYLNLTRNAFSHRKAKEVTRSIRDFFSRSEELRYVGLSGTKLPAEALRLLLQGLATNTRLSALELDLSCCELRSAGAQVIQDHIFEAKAISSLDLSDNGLESNMVTLVLAIGRSHSIRHLALGRNFAMKSRALTDVLHRIVQLMQEEECPLESLSVSDSRLKTGTTILINSLGRNSTLTKIDISGNCIGDTGAKMLAKALLINTNLRTLVWDRNNVTASGLMDIANALEKNSTLQFMSLPMSDVAQAYRSCPERTEKALQKIQTYLMRNSQLHQVPSEHVLRLQQSLRNSHLEQLVQGLCLKVHESIRPLATCCIQEVQNDILSAEEALRHAKASISVLPMLFDMGMSHPSDDVLQRILADTAGVVAKELCDDTQEMVQEMLQSAQAVCSRVVQRSSISEQLASCVSRKSHQAALFCQETLVQHVGKLVRSKLREMRQAVSVSLTESIISEVIQGLTVCHQKLEKHIKEFTQPSAGSTSRTNIPQLRVVEAEFPTDEYVPVIWTSCFHTTSIRPAPSVKSLLEGDSDLQQVNESQQCPQDGGGAQTQSADPSYTEERQSSSQSQQEEAIFDLITVGQQLHHHTCSRPHPKRKHHRPSSRLPKPAEADRVDEGVEEFFKKRVVTGTSRPQVTEALRKAESVGTECPVHSCTSYKDVRKKFGDFFAFKKARESRGTRLEGPPEDRVKKTCIADLIRPLKAAAQRETVETSHTADATLPVFPVTVPVAGNVPSKQESSSPDTKRRLGSQLRCVRQGKARSLILPGELLVEGDAQHRRCKRKEEARNIEALTPDCKPSPPPAHLKPRTMSTSSDPRRAARVHCVQDLPSTEPPLLPERPASLSLRPAARPTTSRTTSPTCEGRPAPPEPQCRRKPLPVSPAHRREAPPIPRLHANIHLTDICERVHSDSEEYIPTRQPRTKNLAQRRATSVHEGTLCHPAPLPNPDELKAELAHLPRPPQRVWSHLGDQPPKLPERDRGGDTKSAKN